MNLGWEKRRVPLAEVQSRLRDETFEADMIDALDYEKFQLELWDCLKSISHRRRMAIAQRFGLPNGEEKTFEEIGKLYGVTREAARQRVEGALRNLRDPDRSRKLRSWRT